MTLYLFFLIIFSVSLSSVAQIILKTGMSVPHTQEVLVQGSYTDIILSLLTNWQVISGLGLYFIGALAWLFVLARVDVSFAYPFVGLGFILTMILGALVLSETISVSRLVGTFLVVLGVALVARS